MTTATLARHPDFRRGGTGRISAGVSETADYLRAQVKRALFDNVRTASGQNLVLPVNDSLDESYREAVSLAATGEQALPSPAALREAHELLAALPHWCSPPAALVEPSGAIAFEWDSGPHRWLILALRGTGTIEYSAVLGLGVEKWGVGNFAGNLGGDELELLSRVMRVAQALNDEIEAEEPITRFLRTGSHMRTGKGRPQYAAFLPRAPDGEISVYRTLGLGLAEITELGAKFVSPNAPLRGHCTLLAQEFFDEQLTIESAPIPHERHANVRGWTIDARNRILAHKLADKASLVVY